MDGRAASAARRESLHLRTLNHVIPSPRTHDAAAGRRAAGYARRGRHRRLGRAASAHRCRSRHHQSAGADQHRRPGPGTRGGGKAGDLSYRKRNGRSAGHGRAAVAFQVRPFAGHDDVPGWHRPLPRPPTGDGTPFRSAGRTPARPCSEARTCRHGARRNLLLQPGLYAGCFPQTRHP